MTDRAAESQGKALVVAEAPRAFWTAWAKGCTRVRQREAVSGTSLDTGHRQHVLPKEGVHGLGLGRGPLSMMGYALGQHIIMEVVSQYQSQTPSRPQGNHCCSPPQKRCQGTPGNRQLWSAAGDTHLTDLSLHREWSRPSLEPGAIEICLQAG